VGLTRTEKLKAKYGANKSTRALLNAAARAEIAGAAAALDLMSDMQGIAKSRRSSPDERRLAQRIHLALVAIRDSEYDPQIREWYGEGAIHEELGERQ